MTYIYAMSYPGNKSSPPTLSKIIGLIPKCELFIDAMCGSAVVAKSIPQDACIVVTNDLNRSLQADHHLPYWDLLDVIDYRRYGTACIYFDPPYLFSSRRNGRHYYRHEWSDEQHIEFLRFVKRLNCFVMISHYPCDLYNSQLSQWRRFEFKARTRQSTVIEAVYCNYPASVPPLVPIKAIETKSKRQAAKRKCERWINRISALPQAEQIYICKELISKISELKIGSWQTNDTTSSLQEHTILAKFFSRRTPQRGNSKK